MYVGVKVYLQQFFTSALMEVSGQLNAPAASPQEKGSPVLIG
jgi:hypothetical protein